jgi:hypothetical protein
MIKLPFHEAFVSLTCMLLVRGPETTFFEYKRAQLANSGSRLATHGNAMLFSAGHPLVSTNPMLPSVQTSVRRSLPERNESSLT